MEGVLVGEAGTSAHVTIDGLTYPWPRDFRPTAPLRHAFFVGGNLMQTRTRAYDGAGLPEVLDNFSFELPFVLDSGTTQLNEALEDLRTSGGVHTIAYWKQMQYTYKLRAGQHTFWLPRGDAAAQLFDGFTDTQLAAAASIPSLAEPNPTTVYKPSVAADDDVPDGEVWISRDVTEHQESGKWMAFCKLGNAPAAPATMKLRFFPLFRGQVASLTRELHVGIENATLTLYETN